MVCDGSPVLPTLSEGPCESEGELVLPTFSPRPIFTRSGRLGTCLLQRTRSRATATQTKVLGAAHPRRPECRRRTRSKVSPATSHVPCYTCVLLPSTPAHGGTLRDTPQVLCTAITAVAAARPYHPAVTSSRRRSCTTCACASRPTVVRPSLSWLRRRSW